MPGSLKMMALLVASIGLGSAAAAAPTETEGPRVPLLSDAECWKRLPAVEKGQGQPLPSWARALVDAMPRTTASLLQVDYAHRVRSPLDPKLRARMRWVAAHANHCAYSEATALADARRAGLDGSVVAELAGGRLAAEGPAVAAALEFARKMTVNPASVTDEEFAALVKHYGEKDIVAMVQLMAWANFLDRVILALGSPMEPNGPLLPLDVTFAPGQLLTRQPSSPRPGRATTRAKAPIAPGAGKDLVEDEPEWSGVSYDELQARLERQRGRSTRVRVPTWEEVERVIPPGFMWPNRVVWNLVCMGYQPELGGAWETYLRTSSVETGGELDRVFGASLFWVTTRAIDCSYCMGHCEMSLELAGLNSSEIADRTRTLAGSNWSSFPAEEQRAYAFVRKLTGAPWTITNTDVAGLLHDFGLRKGVMVVVAACRGHYMTRISNGFQLSLERDNVFRDWNAPASNATASASGPAPVPLTRPEMKKQLEESKRDQPRLASPPPTAEELAEARRLGTTFSGTRRVRSLLPAELRGGYYFLMDGRTLEYDMQALRNPNATAPTTRNAVDPSRRVEPDPNMTLDYAFKAMLFWVVSRSNNCIYCMGHNETQLSAFGVSEDRIAALDSDWSQFTLAERAALELARKLTVAPQTVTDDDIAAVRRHFNERQVLEMIGIMAGFNAMNRWTGPLRLTQEEFRVFLKPTAPQYETSITRVGPAPAGSAGTRCRAAEAPRPALEPRSAVEAKWAECRERRPRFALVDESAARALLPEGMFPADRPLPNWVRLLAHFPKAGPARIATLRTSETKGRHPARLKAELAWVSARADRSWYALAHARDRLRSLGMDDDAIFAIDREGDSRFTPAERAAFAFARKLTVDPALIGDADFDALRASYSDSEIAELIYHVNHDVFFDRLTEAAQLPLEGDRDGSLSRR